MLWVVFSVLTGIAVFSVLWPLARRRPADKDLAQDVAFYEDRLAEIDREVERALIAPEDAKVVKAEAARRLLATAERAEAAPSSYSTGRVRAASVVALVVVPAVALGLYGMIGHPSWPDQPLEARLQSDPSKMDLPTAIAKVEAHLAQNPNDGRGYEALVAAYLRVGRTDDAARAAATALRLLGDSPQRLTAYGETLVFAADGIVTKDAQEAFTKALAGGEPMPKASLYLGLAAEQDGDKPRAIAIFQKLVDAAPPNAPFTQTLRQKIAELSGQTAAPSDKEAAIVAMPPAERNAMIHGMVDRLATRLAQNGQDLEGWLLLVRAYKNLNEGDKARDALSDARRNLGDDAAATARLDALARELGLEG